MALIWRKPKTPQENTRWKNFALSWKNRFARISQHSREVIKRNDVVSRKIAHYFNEEREGVSAVLEGETLSNEVKSRIRHIRIDRTLRNAFVTASVILPPIYSNPYIVAFASLAVAGIHHASAIGFTKGLEWELNRTSPIPPEKRSTINWPLWKRAYPYAIVPASRWGFTNPFARLDSEMLILTKRPGGPLRPQRMPLEKDKPPKPLKTPNLDTITIFGKRLKRE